MSDGTTDEAKGRVTENRPIKDRNKAVLSFGEDEKGGTDGSAHGRGGK